MSEQINTTTQWCIDKLNEVAGSGSIRMLAQLHPRIRDSVMVSLLGVKVIQAIDESEVIFPEKREKLLKNIYKHLGDINFRINFDELREWQTPAEHLLEEIRWINEAFGKLPLGAQSAIRELIKEMGELQINWSNKRNIDTMDDLDSYCNAQEGMFSVLESKLMVLEKLEGEKIVDLAKHRGLFISKVGLIQQFSTFFAQHDTIMWPRDIWIKYVSNPNQLFDKKYTIQAIKASSEMIHDALSHLQNTIEFVSLLRDPTNLFSMSLPVVIRTHELVLCYANPSLFVNPVHISKDKYNQIVSSLSEKELDGFVNEMNEAITNLVFQAKRSVHDTTDQQESLLRLLQDCSRSLSKIKQSKL